MRRDQDRQARSERLRERLRVPAAAVRALRNADRSHVLLAMVLAGTVFAHGAGKDLAARGAVEGPGAAALQVSEEAMDSGSRHAAIAGPIFSHIGYVALGWEDVTVGAVRRLADRADRSLQSVASPAGASEETDRLATLSWQIADLHAAMARVERRIGDVHAASDIDTLVEMARDYQVHGLPTADLPAARTHLIRAFGGTMDRHRLTLAEVEGERQRITAEREALRVGFGPAR